MGIGAFSGGKTWEIKKIDPVGNIFKNGLDGVIHHLIIQKDVCYFSGNMHNAF